MNRKSEGHGPDLQDVRRAVLERAGGTYDVGEAAELLGVSRSAVRDRIEARALISIRDSSGHHFLPRAQFTEAGTLSGLEEVLDAMHVSAPWMRLQLFLDRDVLGALEEGRLDDAIRAVGSYLPRE